MRPSSLLRRDRARRRRTMTIRFPTRERRCGTSVALAIWRIGLSLARRRWQAHPVVVVDIGGALARADLRTPLGLGLYRYGFCEVESRVLARLLRPGDVFVDGGANVGLLSLIGATVVGPTGRVLACEPGPGTRVLLEANAALNAFETLESHPVALSDRLGTERFVVFENGSGLASFAPRGEGGTIIEVRVTTLDDLTSCLGERVALVKLDIEGAEVKALLGASDLITRAAPLFLVEVESEHLARQGASADDLSYILEPHGYEAYAITVDARLIKLSGPWRSPDEAHPNLVLASPRRAERLSALTAGGDGAITVP